MKSLPVLIASLLVPAALALGPAAARGSLPYVTSVSTEPTTPCPDSAYQLVIRGEFPYAGCSVLHARVIDSKSVWLLVNIPTGGALSLNGTLAVPWEHRFQLPGLPPPGGTITVGMCVTDTARVFSECESFRDSVHIAVSDYCAPPQHPFDFISRIFIAGLGPDGVPKAPICPTDSILVAARGWLPNDCYQLRRIELLPPLYVAPFPVPPTLRFVFDDMACLDRACIQATVPWDARVVLPPLPTHVYNLYVEAALVSCSDSVGGGDPLELRWFPFAVAPADSCEPAREACLWPSWDHSRNSGGCDAVLDHEGRATVTMNLMTTVALAGLQGVIRVDPPGMGLGIEALEPIGPAAGMAIQTTRIPGGMRFVLFALEGAPIPPSDVLSGLSILRVRLVPTPMPAYGLPPDRYTISAHELLGADANAQAVGLCPIRTLDTGAALIAEVATVCARRRCDFNHDGFEDVRDLVGMIRCLNGLPPCDVTRTHGIDCQGDGDFDLDDVVCCAIQMLGTRPCPTCTGDSSRVAPGVSLEFGEPEATATGLRVPVRVNGTGQLGAVRFAVDYPQAGYRLAAVETGGVPATWLALHAPSGDDLGVALLRIGVSLAPERPLDLALVLEPIEGANGAGELRVSGAEFSAPDGVRLEVSAAEPVMPIGDPSALALSPASPNPFDGGTSFRLTLGSRGRAVLGIYDLAGRRVATLHDGVLPVGVHAFTWDGRRDDGGRAGGGVYFYRAESGGRAVSRKLVRLGGR